MIECGVKFISRGPLMEKPSARFRDHMRHGWSGLVIAPVGTGVAGLLFFVVSFAFDPNSTVTVHNIETALGIVFAMILTSYLVGLLLLPVFLLFERLHWRGWRVYVPTASLAGVVTASLTEEGARWDAHLAAVSAIGAVCGALCGAVFAKRLDAADWGSSAPLSLVPTGDDTDPT